MRKAHAILVLLLALSVLSTGQPGPQQPATTEKEANTKLEAFKAQAGTVLIRGYSSMGKITVPYSGTVEVTAVELSDTSPDRKVTGIFIDVDEAGRIEHTGRAFIDYDEIDSLLKGIDYICKVTSDVTPLNNFEATYRTKGHFGATTFSSSGTIKASVDCGYVRPATAFFTLQQLGELRQNIEKAKGQLDSMK